MEFFCFVSHSFFFASSLPILPSISFFDNEASTRLDWPCWPRPAMVAGFDIAMRLQPAWWWGEMTCATWRSSSLRRADVAMHLAKRDGLRRAPLTTRRLTLPHRTGSRVCLLRDALSTTDQLLSLQPTVDAVNRAPVGAGGAGALAASSSSGSSLARPEFIQAIGTGKGTASPVMVSTCRSRSPQFWAAAGVCGSARLSVNVCARALALPRVSAGGRGPLCPLTVGADLPQQFRSPILSWFA